jgi:hypothetical protein
MALYWIHRVPKTCNEQNRIIGQMSISTLDPLDWYCSDTITNMIRHLNLGYLLYYFMRFLKQPVLTGEVHTIHQLVKSFVILILLRTYQWQTISETLLLAVHTLQPITEWNELIRLYWTNNWIMERNLIGLHTEYPPVLELMRNCYGYILLGMK